MGASTELKQFFANLDWHFEAIALNKLPDAGESANLAAVQLSSVRRAVAEIERTVQHEDDLRFVKHALDRLEALSSRRVEDGSSDGTRSESGMDRRIYAAWLARELKANWSWVVSDSP